MGMPPNPAAGLGAGGGGGANPLSVALGALQNRQTSPGSTLSQQASDLQGADPGMISRQLDAVNQVLGVLFVRTFQSQPNVANQISATMKALSRAIKEAQQGSAVADVVGKAEESMGGGAAPPSPPITFGPAMPAPPPSAGATAT